jgi:hypothetical protein
MTVNPPASNGLSYAGPAGAGRFAAAADGLVKLPAEIHLGRHPSRKVLCGNFHFGLPGTPRRTLFHL